MLKLVFCKSQGQTWELWSLEQTVGVFALANISKRGVGILMQNFVRGNGLEEEIYGYYKNIRPLSRFVYIQQGFAE